MHLYFRDSTLISAAEVSLRQQRGTSSCLIFPSSLSNPIVADSTYGGSLQIPRKFETERLEVMGERAFQQHELVIPLFFEYTSTFLLGVISGFESNSSKSESVSSKID